MRMITPALITLLCPFFPSACEPSDEPVETARAARIVIADEPRRVRMGSTSGDSTTSEPEGTTTGDEGTTTSTSTGDETGMPVQDTDGGCPWYGCDPLPETWPEIMTDCSYPVGQREVGEAKCTGDRTCLALEDFEMWGEYPAWSDPAETGIMPAICTISCPPVWEVWAAGGNWLIDPCYDVTDDPNVQPICAALGPGMGDVPHYCLPYEGGYFPGYYAPAFPVTTYVSDSPMVDLVMLYVGPT